MLDRYSPCMADRPTTLKQQRYIAKKLAGGKVSFSVWIDGDLRNRIAMKARVRGLTQSEFIEDFARRLKVVR